jgi:hypothetical protein
VVHDAAAPGAVRVAAAVLLAAAIAGCGSSPGSSKSVAWVGKPIVVRQPELPADTVVSGRIVNEGHEALELDAADVKVLGSDGAAVESTARFAVGVSHQLYPPREGPDEPDPDFLRRRLGEVATVEPGKSVPFVVAWRLGQGDRAPAEVDLGAAGSLTLPLDPG